MNLSINAKHVDIGETLRSHVVDSLNGTVTKYFDNALDSTVTFSRESRLFRVDISVHAGRGMMMQGGATNDDAYAAFDGALMRIAKQLRRYKRRLKDHHKGRGEKTLPAQQYILAAQSEDSEVDVGDQPTIVAELPTEISTLTVGEAVMRMDLADTPAMMFRNRAHGRLNVIYRRPDGNIGWIDPDEAS
jgi:ribosomal subunit interface protein